MRIRASSAPPKPSVPSREGNMPSTSCDNSFVFRRPSPARHCSKTQAAFVLLGILGLTAAFAAALGYWCGPFFAPILAFFKGSCSSKPTECNTKELYTCESNLFGMTPSKYVCIPAGHDPSCVLPKPFYVRPPDAFSLHHGKSSSGAHLTQKQVLFFQSAVLKSCGIETIHPSIGCMAKTPQQQLHTFQKQSSRCPPSTTAVLRIEDAKDFTAAKFIRQKALFLRTHRVQWLLSNLFVCDMHIGNYGSLNNGFFVQDIDCSVLAYPKTRQFDPYYTTHHLLELNSQDLASNNPQSMITVGDLKAVLDQFHRVPIRDLLRTHLPASVRMRMEETYRRVHEGLEHLVHDLSQQNSNSTLLAEAKGLKKHIRAYNHYIDDEA